MTLKILCALPIHSSLSPPKPLATTDLFTMSIVLPFPEYHSVELILTIFKLTSFT